MSVPNNKFREGILALANGVETWPPPTMESDKVTARQILRRHEHPPMNEIPQWDREKVRENCGACVFVKAITEKNEPPNYAGWLRVLLQTHTGFPKKWLLPELERAERENPAYYYAIRKDLATYGLPTLTE